MILTVPFFVSTGCWRRDHVERPLFKDILADIKSLERSKFYTTTSHEEFRTMQSTWRGEIQKKFMELKKMEHVSKILNKFVVNEHLARINYRTTHNIIIKIML